jgi:hypothetical protein
MILPSRHRTFRSLLTLLLAGLGPIEPALAGTGLTFMPLTATTFELPSSSIARVEYVVTNVSALSRTFAVVPVAGINVITSGAGVCASPFVLASQQSCVLALDLVGADLGAGVQGGPMVCLHPGTLTCFQPNVADALNVTVEDTTIFADGFE